MIAQRYGKTGVVQPNTKDLEVRLYRGDNRGGPANIKWNFPNFKNPNTRPATFGARSLKQNDGTSRDWRTPRQRVDQIIAALPDF